MTQNVNPPPIIIPQSLRQDPDTASFFTSLTFFLQQLWRRTGGGTDEVAATQIREFYGWNLSDSGDDEDQSIMAFSFASEADSPYSLFNAITKTNNYTSVPFDFVNAKSGAEISFPAQPNKNDVVIIRNGDNSRIKLNGNGKTINGSNTGEIVRKGTCIIFQYFIDSDEWFAR